MKRYLYSKYVFMTTNMVSNKKQMDFEPDLNEIGRLTKNSSNPMYIKINDWLFTRLFNQKYLNHIMKYWNIFVVRIHTCTSLKNKLYLKVFINPVQLLKKRFFFFFEDIKRWFLFVLKHTPYWRFVKHNKSISKKKINALSPLLRVCYLN